jgi:hypothetical protein
MPSITQIDRTFGPGPVQMRPHAPSNGMGFLAQVNSAYNWLIYTARDILTVPRLVGVQIDDPNSRFVHTMSCEGKLLAKDLVLLYQKMLEETYKESSVLFIPYGMDKNRSIAGVDPLFVIAGKEKRGDNDLVVDEPKNRFEESKEKMIVYPFVYPAKRAYNTPHIAFNIVDRQEAVVAYYDPQGLTSDDPCRQVFTEPFNMHENLVELAETIFPDRDSQVSENLTQHQVDPVNCGTIGLGVLENLYQGKSIEAALTENPAVVSPSEFRKKLCRQFMEMQAAEKMPLFDAKRHQRSERKLSPPKESDLDDFEVL